MLADTTVQRLAVSYLQVLLWRNVPGRAAIRSLLDKRGDGWEGPALRLRLAELGLMLDLLEEGGTSGVAKPWTEGDLDVLRVLSGNRAAELQVGGSVSALAPRPRYLLLSVAGDAQGERSLHRCRVAGQATALLHAEGLAGTLAYALGLPWCPGVQGDQGAQAWHDNVCSLQTMSVLPSGQGGVRVVDQSAA